MEKYEEQKKFQHDCQFQVYMYDFMFIDPERMPVEDHFPDIKTYVDNNKKISTPGLVPKHWLSFSYKCSEDYELDLNFYET